MSDKTAATMLAELAKLDELNRSQIAALVGVAPCHDDSGQHQSQRRITGGRVSVRNILYLAVQSAMRHNPVIKAFAQKLRCNTEHKTAPKEILVACMRKLLVILNTMLKNKTSWNPAIVPSFTLDLEHSRWAALCNRFAERTFESCNFQTRESDFDSTRRCQSAGS